MLCFRGGGRGSRRWVCLRSRRIRDGEPMHGQAKQAAKPHPSETPNLFCPVHLISRRNAACRVSICESSILHLTKNRRDRSTLIVPETGTERQSRRYVYQLRKCTCQEYRSILSPRASWTHQEHDILPALQRRLNLRKVVRTVHGLLVHFQDHVAAIQTEILGERSLLHILHHHALASRNAQAIRQIGSDAANRNPKLAGLGRFFALVFVLFTQTGSKQFRAIRDGHRRVLPLAVAHEGKLGLRTGFAGSNVRYQIVAALHVLAIHGGDGVADLQARLVGRAAGYHVRHRHARSVNARDRRIRLRRELNANRPARNPVLRPDQLVIDLRHRVRGHGKSHAGVRTRLRQNGGIDADDFTRHIHQRPSGIARVNRSVGLNKRLELPVGNDVAPLGRHDARRHSFLQPERTADGEHPVANVHAVGVAKFCGRQRTIHFNLNHRQVGLLVHTDQFGVMPGRGRVFIHQLHTNAIGLLDHVPVGDDVALGIHNNARTERALADGACFWATLTTLASEELNKEILERSVFIAVALILIRIGTDGAPPVRVLDSRFRINVHHARLKLLGNLGERVRELLRSGNRERSRIRRFLSLFAFHSRGDNRANQNSNGERRQNRKRIGPTIGLERSKKSAFARIHFFPPENYLIFYYTFDTGRGRGEGAKSLDAGNPVSVTVISRRDAACRVFARGGDGATPISADLSRTGQS